MGSIARFENNFFNFPKGSPFVFRYKKPFIFKVLMATLRVLRHFATFFREFLVGAFYQNEPDYYSDSFFSSDHRMYA